MADDLSSAPVSPWLHRFAVLVAVCTLGLIFAGGLVTSKGAGLAVPDWPLSYGSLNPEGWLSIENLRAEHGHRLIAGAVGILTLILTIWVWKREPRRWARWLAVAALAAVILQALLGGLTVLYYLPTPISVSHALLAQTFLCLTVALALATSPQWKAGPVRKMVDGAAVPLHYLAIGLTAAICIQLVFGALMRHTESGLAIAEFPLAFGKKIIAPEELSLFGYLLPPLDEITIHNINVDRFHMELKDTTAGQIVIHFLHRVGAVGVCLIAAWVCLRIARVKAYRDRAGLIFPTMLVFGLLIVQIILGALTIWTTKQPHIATAHVTVGAAILAASFILTLHSMRLVRRIPVARRVAVEPKPAEPKGATS